MKKIIFGLLVLLAGFAVFAQSTDLPGLAVVEFAVNSTDAKTAQDAVTVRSLVESNVVASGKYRVVTRSDIDKLLSEQRIQLSSISSKENRDKLELAKINYIITGEVNAMGGDYAITLKILDVSNGKFSHSADDFIGGSSRELYAGVKTLVTNFMAGMKSDSSGGIVQGKEEKVYKIGETGQAGGIVFYDKGNYSDGWRYLEAAPQDIGRLEWGWFAPFEKKIFIPKKLDDAQEALIKKYEGKSPPKGSWDEWELDTAKQMKNIYDLHNKRDEMEINLANLRALADSARPNVDGTRTEIGSGKRNTQLVADVLKNAGYTGKAAQRCISYSYNGYSDWFLPSKDELAVMYKNIAAKGIGNFGSGQYWSSSQSDSRTTAWVFEFHGDGSSSSLLKGYAYNVRAIRAF